MGQRFFDRAKSLWSIQRSGLDLRAARKPPLRVHHAGQDRSMQFDTIEPMDDAPAAEPSPSDAPRSSQRPRLRARDAWVIALAAAVVVLDQFTKWLVRHTLAYADSWPSSWPVHFVHYTNNGAAFSTLQGSGPILVVASLLGAGGILVYALKSRSGDPWLLAGLSLMLGGAVGNLIDRAFNGEVVDFIQFPHFPAFNVADSCITIGAVLLLFTFARGAESRAESKASPAPPD